MDRFGTSDRLEINGPKAGLAEARVSPRECSEHLDDVEEGVTSRVRPAGIFEGPLELDDAVRPRVIVTARSLIEPYRGLPRLPAFS